ncbi:uncharacterized protein [Musca autumnalis]|uniref:uncharacterized protein n=1 Tax=Musca autumnalis TaxID=221902 RepID=UPI003CF75487
MAEPEQNNQGTIRDLSQTINVGSPITNSLGPVYLQGAVGGDLQGNENTPQVNLLGQRVLESKIQTLKTEMDEIKNMLLNLTKTIQEGNRVGQIHNQVPERRVHSTNSAANVASTSGGVAHQLNPPPNQLAIQGQVPNSHSMASTNGTMENRVDRENVAPQGVNTSNQLVRQFPAQSSSLVPFDPRYGIRMNKLGLRFDGSSSGLSVEEFVYRLEYFQRQYGIPWAEIIRDFPLMLTGRAESWYWLFEKTHKFHDWEDLKHSLLSQYQSSKTNVELIAELAQRRQQPNESIDTYFHAMGQLRAKLVQPLSEFDMIKIMKKNIRENVSRIVYPIQVSSVEQLRIECNEAEKNFLRREIRPYAPPPSRPQRQVNEVEYDGMYYPEDFNQDRDGVGEVDALQTMRQRNPNIGCWNCQKSGHTFRECEATTRALFCYRCGKPGTKTPQCDVCQQGNRNRGVDTTGGPRPTVNP